MFAVAIDVGGFTFLQRPYVWMRLLSFGLPSIHHEAESAPVTFLVATTVTIFESG